MYKLTSNTLVEYVPWISFFKDKPGGLNGSLRSVRLILFSVAGLSWIEGD
jgi:hypothetical protein